MLNPIQNLSYVFKKLTTKLYYCNSGHEEISPEHIYLSKQICKRVTEENNKVLFDDLCLRLKIQYQELLDQIADVNRVLTLITSAVEHPDCIALKERFDLELCYLQHYKEPSNCSEEVKKCIQCTRNYLINNST